ncbi:uncharacterized protein LOC131999385 [Mustela nigripes]|uniref:uncharacterized protein LOC131999385 n=1 Tax=Mustela nigripes TaxID=77151 RepID=UPI002815D65B|nr:uncharacterized protein LOC131999385 [Mustela nigripes]
MRKHEEALLGLLCIQVCWVRGMTVEQSPSALSHQEGASFTLQCNFSQTAGSVQWFRQHPGGGGLTRLFYIASGMQQSGRLNCTVNTRERSSTLHIRTSQLEDSATYLCAAQAQCSLVICSLHPNCAAPAAPALPHESPLQVKISSKELLDQVTEMLLSSALKKQIFWQNVQQQEGTLNKLWALGDMVWQCRLIHSEKARGRLTMGEAIPVWGQEVHWKPQYICLIFL